MRIYPRSLDLPGDVGGVIYLNNSSVSGRILLYKIKRSDPKVVDFSPKRGVVEADSTLKVDIKFCTDTVCSTAKVLVQLVAVSRADYRGSFEHDWVQGMESGMVKKVIEVRRQDATGKPRDGDDDGDGDEGSVSVISDGEGGKRHHRTPARKASDHHGAMDTPESAASEFLGTAQTSMVSTFAGERVHRAGERKSGAGAHTAEVVSPIKGTPVRGARKPTGAGAAAVGAMNDDALLKYLERKEFKAKQQRAAHRAFASNDGEAAQHSTLAPFSPDDFATLIIPVRGAEGARLREKLFAARQYEGTDAVVVVQGEAVNDEMALRCVESRVDESSRQRRRVVGIALRRCAVHTLDESVGSAFPAGPSNRPDDKANASLGFLLEAHLHHLLVQSTKLQLVDPSINRFDKLVTLDLSRNEIVKIVGPLELPHLVSLDLAHNILSSVDFLEQLRALRFLNLSFNCITTLEGSVNMLVPLAKNIRQFNMSHNAVCRDERYVVRVLDILPRLTHFDGKDLKAMHAEVHRQHAQRRAASVSVLGRSQQTTGSSVNTSGLSRSGPGGGRRSASPGPATLKWPTRGRVGAPTGVDISRVRGGWGVPNASNVGQQASNDASAAGGPHFDDFELRLIRALRKKPYAGGQGKENVGDSRGGGRGDSSYRGDPERKGDASHRSAEYPWRSQSLADASATSVRTARARDAGGPGVAESKASSRAEEDDSSSWVAEAQEYVDLLDTATHADGHDAGADIADDRGDSTAAAVALGMSAVGDARDPVATTLPSRSTSIPRARGAAKSPEPAERRTLGSPGARGLSASASDAVNFAAASPQRASARRSAATSPARASADDDGPVTDAAQTELDRELLLQAQTLALSARQQAEKRQKQQTLIAAWARETRQVQARNERELRADAPEQTARSEHVYGAAKDASDRLSNVLHTSEYVRAAMADLNDTLTRSAGAIGGPGGIDGGVVRDGGRRRSSSVSAADHQRGLPPHPPPPAHAAATRSAPNSAQKRSHSVDLVSDSLKAPTALTIVRLRALGLEEFEDANEAGERRKLGSSFEASIDEGRFAEMQQDERHGRWHPRYRVPKEHFGLSQPFAHRKPPAPSPGKAVPLFEETVRRLREGFEMQPRRGTSSFGPPRDPSKGQINLTAEEAAALSLRLQQLYKNVSFAFLPPTAASASASASPTQQPRGAFERTSVRQTQSLSPTRDRPRLSPAHADPAPELYTGHRKWYGDVPIEQFIKRERDDKVPANRAPFQFASPTHASNKKTRSKRDPIPQPDGGESVYVPDRDTSAVQAVDETGDNDLSYSDRLMMSLIRNYAGPAAPPQEDPEMNLFSLASAAIAPPSFRFNFDEHVMHTDLLEKVVSKQGAQADNARSSLKEALRSLQTSQELDLAAVRSSSPPPSKPPKTVIPEPEPAVDMAAYLRNLEVNLGDADALAWHLVNDASRQSTSERRAAPVATATAVEPALDLPAPVHPAVQAMKAERPVQQSPPWTALGNLLGPPSAKKSGKAVLDDELAPALAASTPTRSPPLIPTAHGPAASTDRPWWDTFGSTKKDGQQPPTEGSADEDSRSPSFAELQQRFAKKPTTPEKFTNDWVNERFAQRDQSKSSP